jgi:hypothetical protein
MGGAAVALALNTTGAAMAQIPGAPVLQNAFANPGLAAAANFGAGSGQSLFALAGAWGLAGGRFQLSGAAGAQRANDATRGAYGVRGSMTVWTSAGGGLGAAAFAGVGGAPRTRSNGVMTNPAVMTIPAGLTVGYRRPLGTTRGSTSDDGAGGDVAGSDGNVRVALGVDFSFNPSFGVTAGTELGGSGSGGSNFGLALSWVPGRR